MFACEFAIGLGVFHSYAHIVTNHISLSENWYQFTQVV